MQKKYSTQHYDFHYGSHSVAERDILQIAEEQERCYKKITTMLGIVPNLRLQYFLFDTPEEVGKAYGDDDDSPCNGFTRLPDSIYAVYNDEIQCIGMHEDTHLISYTRKRPECAFLREGLAMYMDESWWSRPNEEWVIQFLSDGSYIMPQELLCNQRFFELSDALTYPIAGAFVHFLTERMGMERFLEEVYYTDTVCLPYNEQDFRDWLKGRNFTNRG